MFWCNLKMDVCKTYDFLASNCPVRYIAVYKKKVCVIMLTAYISWWTITQTFFLYTAMYLTGQLDAKKS